LLGAVERVEETGEGLGTGREIVRPAKVPDHFAYHVGLAGEIPFVEEVIVNADGEQHIPMFGLMLLVTLDFTDMFFKAPRERTRRTKSQIAQLGGESNGVVNIVPNSLASRSA